MVKKVTTISIDENILKKAKMEIPNLSTFVEECLKQYLGLENEVADMQVELEKIKDSMLKIHLLSKTDYAPSKELDIKKINDTWIKCWGVYRSNGIYNDAQIEKLAGLVDYEISYIKSMMNNLKLYLPKSDLSACDDWENAVKKYNELI